MKFIIVLLLILLSVTTSTFSTTLAHHYQPSENLVSRVISGNITSLEIQSQEVNRSVLKYHAQAQMANLGKDDAIITSTCVVSSSASIIGGTYPLYVRLWVTAQGQINYGINDQGVVCQGADFFWKVPPGIYNIETTGTLFAEFSWEELNFQDFVLDLPPVQQNNQDRGTIRFEDREFEHQIFTREDDQETWTEFEKLPIRSIDDIYMIDSLEFYRTHDTDLTSTLNFIHVSVGLILLNLCWTRLKRIRDLN